MGFNPPESRLLPESILIILVVNKIYFRFLILATNIVISPYLALDGDLALAKAFLDPTVTRLS